MRLSRQRALTLSQQLLESLYPSDQGWKFCPKSQVTRFNLDFILEKQNDHHTHKVIGRIKLSPKVSRQDLKKLHHTARIMSGRYVKIEDKFLMVPFDAVVEEDLGNIHVRYLKDLHPPAENS